MLRAREVRDRCKGRVDPQVMYCLEALAEQQGVMRQQLTELAEITDQTINAVNNLAGALGVMKDFFEGVKDGATERLKHMEHEDDLPPVTE